MKAHELSQILPEMDTADLQNLVEDIKQNGQHEEIVVLDGRILDGRSRFAACKLAKVEPVTREFGDRKSDGDGPMKFVLSENVHRRHLTDEQRAMIAGELAARSEPGRPKEPESEGQDNGNATAVKQDEAAKLLNVSPAAVRRAAKIVKKGGAKLREQLKAGKVSLSKAAAAADAPKEKQLKVAHAKPKKVKRESAKDRLVEALDVWWLEKRKDLEGLPMCPPLGMMRHFRKLIEKVL